MSLLLSLNIFYTFFDVSAIDFEQVNAFRIGLRDYLQSKIRL